MAILALDTALDLCQAGVVVDGRLAGVSAAPSKGDAEAIVDHAAAALAAAGLGYGDLSAVAVTVGPGSFTGVRVGIAFAKAVGLARAVPVRGCTSLDALAEPAERPVTALVDARHNAVFAARYEAGDIAPVFALRLALADALGRAAGSALVAHAPLAEALRAAGDVDVDAATLDPLGVTAAAEMHRRLPRAVYLAEADAAPLAGKALSRAV